jgi:hypothetical protein
MYRGRERERKNYIEMCTFLRAFCIVIIWCTGTFFVNPVYCYLQEISSDNSIIFTAFLATSARSSFMYLHHTVTSLTNEYISLGGSKRKIRRYWKVTAFGICYVSLCISSFISVLWILWAVIKDGSHFQHIFLYGKTKLSSTCASLWKLKQRILGGERGKETLFINWSYAFLYQWCENVSCERIWI